MRTLSNDDGDVNENFKKAIGLDWPKKETNLHVHHAFLYIALPSLHDYDVKFHVLWRTWKCEQIESFTIQLQKNKNKNKKIVNIWRIERDVIITINFEAARLNSLSVVFVVIAFVVAEAP